MSPSKRTRVGHALARLLAINPNYRHEPREDLVGSGGKSDLSVSTGDSYIEAEPTAGEWIRGVLPTRQFWVDYLRSLFPFYHWIFHYNLQWLFGDLVAGITVGFVVIPQGMAYALLAKLPPEYGLYTSFVGFLLYWAFATSKDITIGTVAVMSTIVGNIVIKVQDQHPDIPAEQIARALAVVCGGIILFIGLIRCGFIVEFIPLVAITSFMTGAAISIAVGQVPAMLGIAGINTREATYKVVVNTLKGLPRVKLDAALGLTALTMLYLIRYFCAFMSTKQPNRRKLWFFVSTLRMAFVVLLYTMIGWLVNRNVEESSKAKFRILGNVPRGFRHAGAPYMDARLVRSFAGDIPASVIVILIEHIAISKSFGRINNYTINPSQEMVAIGFTNVFGPFLGAYPATGSFSRTAIKSKAGVRTPLAGIFTAVVVLLALYALTSVFYYIPLSSLAGLIVHAVGDLITPPNVVYQFWEVSPLEVPIFFAGVIVTVFTNIENGIYLTIAASGALLLSRLAMAKGRFLGRVKIYSANRDLLLGEGSPGFDAKISREAFLPLGHQDGSNPQVELQSPHPGIFIYRFSEGLIYPNQSHYLENLTEYIFKQTRPTELQRAEKLGDRPWNDPGPRRGHLVSLEDNRPILRAIVLDFSSVNHVDVTSVQGLIDVRNQLDRYAAPETVEWHVACITNRWTKRALAAAGFGYPTAQMNASPGEWKPIFSVADLTDDATSRGNSSVARSKTDIEAHDTASSGAQTKDASDGAVPRTSNRVAVVGGLNRPFFHVDVTAAVQSAIANADVKSSSRGR